MDIKNLFKGERDYFSRRLPVVIIIFAFGAFASYLGASNAYNYLIDLLGKENSGAPFFAFCGAFLIEAAKFSLFSAITLEAVKYKYNDLIIYSLSALFIGISLYTSTSGMQLKTEAKATLVADSILAEKSEIDTIGISLNSLVSANTEKASPSASIWGKARLVEQQAARTAAASESLEALSKLEALKLEREKIKERRSDSRKKEALKSGENKYYYLIILELITLVCSLCIGYIFARKGEKKN